MSGIVVVGATGGCGVTTTACALALLLVGEARPVLLVDADVHGGGPGAMWAIDAARGMDDLAGLGADVGQGHVDHLVHRHPSGVDVVAGAHGPGSPVAHEPRVAAAVAGHAAARPCWVADAGRGDTPLAAALLARADRALLLVPCTMQGALRARRTLALAGDVPVEAVAATWPAGERVRPGVLARALGGECVTAFGRDARAAADVAAAHAPRGRGMARALGALVAS